MSGISNSESEGMEADGTGEASRPMPSQRGNNIDRSNYGRKGSRGPWAHLDADVRKRYEAIEERVREKMKRGEL